MYKARRVHTPSSRWNNTHWSLHLITRPFHAPSLFLFVLLTRVFTESYQSLITSTSQCPLPMTLPQLKPLSIY